MAGKLVAVQMHGCISSVYIFFHFKWYSLLHFAVRQLLCWAFLFVQSSAACRSDMKQGSSTQTPVLLFCLSTLSEIVPHCTACRKSIATALAAVSQRTRRYVGSPAISMQFLTVSLYITLWHLFAYNYYVLDVFTCAPNFHEKWNFVVCRWVNTLWCVSIGKYWFQSTPHIYASAKNAYWGARRGIGKTNQSLIISGESGSGKVFVPLGLTKFQD